MPPKPRITRQMILDAAFALVRTEGHEALTARRLAAALGCSTQPILYQFESIDQLAALTYARADEYHTAFLMEGLEAEDEPMLCLGLRYIRFGAEERPLFRFLFQSGRFSGRSPEELTHAPEAAPLVGVLSASAGLDEGRAAELFTALFAAVHGYASLLANNAMRYDPEAAAAMLTGLFDALIQKER